jgi:CRISPR-associated protein Cas1
MATLYVTEPGSRVEKDHGRLLVTKDDEVLLAAPLAHVTEVVLMGGTGLTTPAMLALLDAGVSVSLISAQGKLRGRLIAAEARNLPLRHKQYAASSSEKFCREISRAIVLGKLKNCRTLARRLARARTTADNRPQTADDGRQTADDGPQTADRPTDGGRPPTADTLTADALIARLTDSIQKARMARDVAELRGLEGNAAKAYFALLRAALRPELSFEKRTRRPPKDPANALLSLAYSLLTNAVFTACEVAGLDPYDGFFHADKYGRPALALDLVEEFRPIVADSVVLTVVNNRMLGPDDFETGEDGGVFLARRGRRIFLQQFSRRLNTEVLHPQAGRALSYQKVFEVQARQLRKCIESGEPNYQPFLAR